MPITMSILNIIGVGVGVGGIPNDQQPEFRRSPQPEVRDKIRIDFV